MADLEDVFPDFSMAFEGGEDGGTFYHSDSTRQLDAEYGDMLHKILDLEVRCIQAIAAMQHASVTSTRSRSAASSTCVCNV